MDRREAKQHWNTRTAEWKAWAAGFIREVQEIENPAFRHCVAGLLDGCASGYGHVLVRQRPDQKINLVSFELNPEVEAALKRGVQSFDPDANYSELREQADAWIKLRLKNTNAIQVAWIIAPLRDVSPYAPDSLKTIAVDHIVYDVRRGQFVGVKFDGGGVYRVQV